VAISIYTLSGKLIKTFNGVSNKGRLDVNWEGDNNAGVKVGSGIYLVRMKAGQLEKNMKVVLSK
ncbi:MAG: T9SS type A sorting domain-containing protein, partial [Fibrobacteres bacterium]|nr:T9SS type A sorting domain-containing protein [Fibrobacterota bacterium]